MPDSNGNGFEIKISEKAIDEMKSVEDIVKLSAKGIFYLAHSVNEIKDEVGQMKKRDELFQTELTLQHEKIGAMQKGINWLWGYIRIIFIALVGGLVGMIWKK